MLRYLANGRIRWKPCVRCNTRTNWEFYAVIDGRCGPVFQDGGRPVLTERTLWVFAPECSHGWADDGRAFERIAFHFTSVPYPLDSLVRERGWRAHPLDEAGIARLRAIAAELEPHYVRPTLVSALLFQARLMELAVLMLEGQAPALAAAPADAAVFRIESALAWYGERLARNPTVREVALAMHVSPSHLRRLFWTVRKTSPKAAFLRLRLDRAHELMSATEHTLDDIARQCGFNSASHFCREYRRVHGFTPTHWRKRLVAGFAQELPAGTDPVRQFSARAAERAVSA